MNDKNITIDLFTDELIKFNPIFTHLFGRDNIRREVEKFVDFYWNKKEERDYRICLFLDYNKSIEYKTMNWVYEEIDKAKDKDEFFNKVKLWFQTNNVS